MTLTTTSSQQGARPHAHSKLLKSTQCLAELSFRLSYSLRALGRLGVSLDPWREGEGPLKAAIEAATGWTPVLVIFQKLGRCGNLTVNRHPAILVFVAVPGELTSVAAVLRGKAALVLLGGGLHVQAPWLSRLTALGQGASLGQRRKVAHIHVHGLWHNHIWLVAAEVRHAVAGGLSLLADPLACSHGCGSLAWHLRPIL